ncbi:MAG: type VII toxin-antitoxin system HepT family RNase toxin, partial [Casimicrobiaceae bacterium]
MMQFDRDVLIAKLAQLQDLIARIENKRPDRLDLLLVDRDTQDILSKNIERSVQICVDVATHVATANGFAPTTSGDAFQILSDHEMLDRNIANAMIRAVGFRNVAVHEYVKID